MNKLIFFLILIIQAIIKPDYIQAQCTEFVTTKGFTVLDTVKYIPEGRFDALILSQGDYLKVYKSFFRGKTYKVAVVADNNLPIINFQVKTMEGEIIYDNLNNPNSETWEYTSNKNQNLIIKVELPPAKGSKPQSGCVAVLLGYKLSDK
ncbi:MAG: hypothetical protein L3J56_00115 [Bacteroidales bacterium]|nr:hypothetical protein [Bacteroidales bacterium]